LSFGADGFLLIRYLLLSFSITRLHPCNACWICLWYNSVESLLICVMSFSCRNVCIFLSRVSRSIMTVALFLSALVTISSSLRKISFIWFGVSPATDYYHIHTFTDNILHKINWLDLPHSFTDPHCCQTLTCTN
jgi:hypothetical protein